MAYMMTNFSFEDSYSRCVKGEIDRKELEGAIFARILEETGNFYFKRIEQEDKADFASWLYPRICKAIDAYKDIGASFEAYIFSIVKLSAKEWRHKKADKTITEYAAWSASAYEQTLREEEPQYLRAGEALADAGRQAQKACRVKNPRQLLILALKCYSHISDDFACRIALRLGIPQEDFQKMVAKLSAMRRVRDEKIHLLRERVQTQNCRCLIYQKKLSLLKHDKAAHAAMQKRLDKATKRCASMQKRLASMSLVATNEQVAAVAGISKGAVDAALFQLKAKWEKQGGTAMLN